MNDKDKLKYAVGGLLYTPATNTSIAGKIINNSIPFLTSIAFCLEDTINDDKLEEAEECLNNTLKELAYSSKELPLIFIRIRNPEHLVKLIKKYEKYVDTITGWILPKFDLSNVKEYVKIITSVNKNAKKPTYFMPIFESKMIADVSTRIGTLIRLKEYLATVFDYVLNVRVGGNDFCNLYGIRRAINQSIYEVGVVRDIFVDIINVFASDYVISGPVWEYFSKTENIGWDDGLKRELELDKINGFTGKTAIHPVQLPIIYDSLKVSGTDYEDATAILGWDKDLGVAKGGNNNRMNEVKVHRKWAERIVALANVYGVRED